MRKRRSFQIGPATPGEVSGTKKRDIFLEKNPVKTVENYSLDCHPAMEFELGLINIFESASSKDCVIIVLISSYATSLSHSTRDHSLTSDQGCRGRLKPRLRDEEESNRKSKKTPSESDSETELAYFCMD